MPLPVFDKQEDIPEAFRDGYEQHEGKWRPKLQKALESERTLRETQERETAEERKKREDAEREREELKRKATAKDGGITDAQLAVLRDEDEKKRKPLIEENERLKTENRKLKLHDRVRTLALRHGVMEERIDDAMLLLEPRVDLTESGNDIVVKDKDGKPTSEKIEDFLKTTFKAEKPWAYKGGGGSGTGGDPATKDGDATETGSGSYDPAKEGQEMAKAQKSQRTDLAFR